MNTITHPMIWDSKICGQFEAAKRRAKARVAHLLPLNWDYKIERSDFHKGTMTIFDRYWSIRFSKYFNSISIMVTFSPCRADFDLNTRWINICGRCDDTADVEILMKETELLKQIVEEILVEMNPKNYGG